MNITIRELEEKDALSVAAIWRKTIGLLSPSDESVVKTFDRMKDEHRYRTFVADADGRVVG